MILLPIGVKPLGLESEPLPYLGRGIEPRLESWADPFYDRRFYLPDRNELDPFDRGFKSTEDHGEGDQRSGHSSRWCRGAHSYQDSPSYGSGVLQQLRHRAPPLRRSWLVLSPLYHRVHLSHRPRRHHDTPSTPGNESERSR